MSAMKKCLVVCMVLSLFASSVFAAGTQETAVNWPTKPVSVLIPANVGGDTDTTFRTLSQSISKEIGQPVTLNNMSGGAGSVATYELLNYDADGYMGMWHHYDTILLTMKGMMDKRYDEYLDIAAVVPVTGGEYMLLTNKASGLNNFNDIITYAKANPGKLVIATEAGGYNHLFSAYFAEKAGIDVNIVDFGSAANRIAALVGNQCQILFGTYDNYKGYKNDLNCIACAAETRKEYAPDIPTIKELGYDIFSEKFYLFGFKKGTDPKIVEKMGTAIKNAVASDAGKKVFEKYQYTAEVLTGKAALDRCKQFEEKYKDSIYLLKK